MFVLFSSCIADDSEFRCCFEMNLKITEGHKKNKKDGSTFHSIKLKRLHHANFVSSGICRQQRPRSAWASMQSD